MGFVAGCGGRQQHAGTVDGPGYLGISEFPTAAADSLGDTRFNIGQRRLHGPSLLHDFSKRSDFHLASEVLAPQISQLVVGKGRATCADFDKNELWPYTRYGAKEGDSRKVVGNLKLIHEGNSIGMKGTLSMAFNECQQASGGFWRYANFALYRSVVFLQKTM
ncbi:hypothetical protein [Burkholderia pseudomallei]